MRSLWSLAQRLGVAVCLLVSMRACEAASISLTNPANNAQNLICTVPVQASVGVTSPEYVTRAPELTIRNSMGQATVVQMTAIDWPPTVYQYLWNTLSGTNGPYTLQATLYYRPNLQATMDSTKVSSLVNVTIKNGFELVTDVNKTYARVNSPTNGQSFTIPATMTINTDHKITWNRFDGCGMYLVSYRWKQSATWMTAATTKQVTVQSYMLPQGIGETFVLNAGMAYSYQTALPYGGFTADAFTETPAGTTVAHGVTNFIIAQ